MSPDSENESILIEHSSYYGDAEFEHALQQYNSKISILSINCQSLNAKFDKLKLFLDDINTKNQISVICVQETWNHEGTDTNCFSLPNYRPISRVVIGREVDYRSRLIYVRYCFTNTTLCL